MASRYQDAKVQIGTFMKRPEPHIASVIAFSSNRANKHVSFEQITISKANMFAQGLISFYKANPFPLLIPRYVFNNDSHRGPRVVSSLPPAFLTTKGLSALGHNKFNSPDISCHAVVSTTERDPAERHQLSSLLTLDFQVARLISARCHGLNSSWIGALKTDSWCSLIQIHMFITRACWIAYVGRLFLLGSVLDLFS